MGDALPHPTSSTVSQFANALRISLTKLKRDGFAVLSRKRLNFCRATVVVCAAGAACLTLSIFCSASSLETKKRGVNPVSQTGKNRTTQGLRLAGNKRLK